MRLLRAGSHPARSPRPALRIASVSRAIVRLGRGRLRRHLIIERCGPFDPPLTEDRPSHCSANAFSRVDLAARAREGAVRFVCTMLLPWIRIRPRHVADLLGLGPRVARSFLDLAVCRVPTRSYRRSRSDDVTRSDDPGGLGRLSLGCFSRQSAQLVGWVFRARVGAARRRPRSIRPMSAAHGCCFQRRGPKSRQTPHRRFPRDAGALGFTPSSLTSVF
jgi:hypothetical protein